jgi:hypothetical protein
MSRNKKVTCSSNTVNMGECSNNSHSKKKQTMKKYLNPLPIKHVINLYDNNEEVKEEASLINRIKNDHFRQ